MEHIGTVEKASDLLFFLSAQRSACGLSQIARSLELPKSSAHRLLQSLRYRHLVEQDGKGRYRLGAGCIALGLGAAEQDALVRQTRPILEQQARSVGETFFLVAARAKSLVVLDKVEGSSFLRASPQVGASVPVHATAVGKVYLAFAPDLVELEEPLEVYTPATKSTAQALEPTVSEARCAGYSHSEDEWQQGLSAVAAPILTAGRMLGTIASALASARMRELGVDRVAASVVAAAERAAAALSRVAAEGERA
jgi:IclR family transcriptional regulator, acetate operon repressor